MSSESKKFGAAAHIYKSFSGSLPPSVGEWEAPPLPDPLPPDYEAPTEPLDWGWYKVVDSISFRRWVVFNDGGSILRVRVNDIENDDILIYPKEYFGDAITGKHVWIKNDDEEFEAPYRIVLGNVH